MTIVTFLSYAGIFVFAIEGALKARKFKMDLVGGFVLAFVLAYGGGTFRDVVIGIEPVSWINDNITLLLVMLAVALTFVVKRDPPLVREIIFYSDTLGIGLFTASGIRIAQNHGVNDPYSLFLGVITATFGGLIADVISGQVPTILKKSELYASLCAIGGLIYLGLSYFHVGEIYALLSCVASIFILRIVTKKYKITLPLI